jgi:cysteine desulfurase family protein (TIGR01976 family)
MTHDARRTKNQKSDIALLSVDEIRARFPALERRENGLPVAYFDGPGGTQVPRDVAEAMVDYLYHHNANTNWNYPSSAETDAAIADARLALADFLGADASEIAFGQNMTSLTFHLSRGLGRRFGEGDEVIVTELDHHANVAPWTFMARERGMTVRCVAMRPETGELDWDDLERKLSPRTRLLAIGAGSNALGTITDVARASRLAREAGALTFVDAVHYAPHALVDVRAIDCDFLACSAYKFYGPHIGMLYGRRALIESLDVPRLFPAPDTSPERLETGTQSHESIVGAAAAVNFLASLAGGGKGGRRAQLASSFAMLHERGQELITGLWRSLESIGGVRLFGPPPGSPRTPTISFEIENADPASVAGELAERGVFVSHGDFYATTVIERLGKGDTGVIRAGCAAYTTEDEVARLVDGVRAIRARGSRAA